MDWALILGAVGATTGISGIAIGIRNLRLYNREIGVLQEQLAEVRRQWEEGGPQLVMSLRLRSGGDTYAANDLVQVELENQGRMQAVVRDLWLESSDLEVPNHYRPHLREEDLPQDLPPGRFMKAEIPIGELAVLYGGVGTQNLLALARTGDGAVLRSAPISVGMVPPLERHVRNGQSPQLRLVDKTEPE